MNHLEFPSSRAVVASVPSLRSPWTVLPSGRIAVGVRAEDDTIVELLHHLEQVVVDQELIEVHDVEPTIAELEVARPFAEFARWQALAQAHGWCCWWQPQLTRDCHVWTVLLERVW